MPAKSRAQQEAIAIAEHHPDQLYARNKGMLNMTHQQMHDFASGSEKGKPEHVKHDLRQHAVMHGHARHADAYVHGAENQRKGLHKGLHHGGLIHHASGYGHSGPAGEAYAQGAMNEAQGMHAQPAAPLAEPMEPEMAGEDEGAEGE